MPPYRIPRHCNIVVALSVVHNFIQEHDAEDEYFWEASDEKKFHLKPILDFGNRARDFSINSMLHMHNLETGQVLVMKFETNFRLTM